MDDRVTTNPFAEQLSRRELIVRAGVGLGGLTMADPGRVRRRRWHRRHLGHHQARAEDERCGRLVSAPHTGRS